MLNIYKPQLKTIQFPGGQTAQLLETLPTISSSDVSAWFDLPAFRFSIAIHGGAAGFETTPEQKEKLVSLLRDSLIRFAQDNQALVSDGGTDTGIPHFIGEAYRAVNASFPLMGVAVSRGVTYPGGPEPADERWALNEAHTHFIVVNADEFGAESHLLVGTARMRGNPGVAIAVNGGGIVQAEIEMHALLGTPVIALKGTGRYTDQLAQPDSPLRQPFIRNVTPLEVFDIDTQPAEDLYHLLRRLLLR